MSKAQEDLDELTALVEKLGLDDEEATSFIGSAMKRLGHRPKLSWEDGDDSGNGDGVTDFFARKRKPETRSARPDRQRRSGSDWQYGRGA